MGLRAYEGLSEVSPVDKLKGFLLLLWRHVTKQDASGGGDTRRRADSSKGKAGDLNICGSALFNQVILPHRAEREGRREEQGAEHREGGRAREGQGEGKWRPLLAPP